MRWTNICAVAIRFCVLVVITTPCRLHAEGSFAVPSSVVDVFQKHCVQCHGDELSEGDVRLDVLSQGSEWDRLALLSKIHEQLHFELMPPEGESRLSDQAQEQVVAWLTLELTKAGQAATFYRGLGISEKSVHGIGHNEASNGKTGLECRSIIRRHHFQILAQLAA